jgi:hypothetical protein
MERCTTPRDGMITWIRATMATFCGGHGCVIRPGDPLEVIQILSYGTRVPLRVRYRCAAHAWTAPPAQIPERAEPRLDALPRLRVPMTIPFDYKAAQCREPGEDG